MLCRCECGQTKIVDNAKLRTGHSRSCGCFRWEIMPAGTPVNRREIRLFGQLARGRVALIDEEDYDLVAPYRWNVREWRKDGRLIAGPYAATSLSRRDHGGKAPTLLMHVLIMGQPYIDHENGNGLDNRRPNLRPATAAQNAANRRMKQSGRSAYKGVSPSPSRKRWIAAIGHGGKLHYLGSFASELSAAYAYDLAAREAHGKFACTNFDAEPPPAVLDAWRAEQNGWRTPERRQAESEFMSELWRQREPEARICVVCGEKYESRSLRSFYCGRPCARVRQRELRLERESG